jgi:hypothetical protein
MADHALPMQVYTIQAGDMGGMEEGESDYSIVHLGMYIHTLRKRSQSGGGRALNLANIN